MAVSVIRGRRVHKAELWKARGSSSCLTQEDGNHKQRNQERSTSPRLKPLKLTRESQVSVYLEG